MALSAKQVAEKYYSDVYKFCCAKCKDKDVAQDITQDTFLFFVAKNAELTNINIRAWLLTVANNKIHEYFREQKIKKSFVCIDDIELKSFDVYESDEINIEDMFDDVQKKILNILNDNEKELFIKLYMERKDISLITKELNITYENFRTRKSRLKKKVKGSIGHLYFFIIVFIFKILK